jgi:hypothetical protein
MELFIRIKDGQPFEHPIFKDNFLQAFPNVDVNNLPPDFAKFQRVTPPKLSPYQVYDGMTYEWDNGIVKDTHHISEISPEAKAAMIAECIALWEASPKKQQYPSWTFCEPCCCFEAPIPYPSDGTDYYWDEPSLAWIEVSSAPG